MEIEEADVRESTGDNFLTVCTFPNGEVMWSEEVVWIKGWIGNDGATWIGETAQIVDVRFVFVSIFS